MTVRLGTRRSALAMAQSRQVARDVERLSGLRVELVGIVTEGDVRPGPLAAMGGTGVFVSALREALLDGRIDVAVHSLKDLPTAPAPGLVVAAVPRREDAHDVLVSRAGHALADLPAGARIGTGSPRRSAALRRARPDLVVTPVRGNVDSRLSRVVDGHIDAVVLARAGLARLGRLSGPDSLAPMVRPIDLDLMPPAPGQGALAVETRHDVAAAHAALAAALAALDDLEARATTTAERGLLAALEAGCSAPVGAVSRLDRGRIHLRGTVFGTDRALTREAAVDLEAGAAEALGRAVAVALLDAGASDLIANGV